VVALAIEVLGTGGAPQGAAGIEVVDVGPRLGDNTEKLSQDLAVRDTGAGVLRSAASGVATPAPGSSGTVGLRVSRSYLLGSPGSSSLPINYRWVEDEAESTCL
jgi:hypothetical protein